MARAMEPLSPSRHPFQIFIMVLCALVGIPVLFGDATPGSISETLPHGFRQAWALLLSIGATVTLIGGAWRNRVTGLLIEQVGLVSAGGATLVYGAALLTTAGKTGYVAAAQIGAFGGACLWRWWQIQRQLRTAHKIEEEHDA